MKLVPQSPDHRTLLVHHIPTHVEDSYELCPAHRSTLMRSNWHSRLLSPSLMRQLNNSPQLQPIVRQLSKPVQKHSSKHMPLNILINDF